METFYENAEYYVWHGMRTLAVDGTMLVLPNHPSIVEEFGQHQFGPKADSPRSLAMGSMLYDVLNQITIDCRLLTVELENGEKEILCTSLTDTEKYGHEDFEQLYHCRWNEEEACKLLKSRVELEDFSGKTARNELQTIMKNPYLNDLNSVGSILNIALFDTKVVFIHIFLNSFCTI